MVSPVRVLKNPKTNEYIKFKQHVLSSGFPLHWTHRTCCVKDTCESDEHGKLCPDWQIMVDVPFMSHCILGRRDFGEAIKSPILIPAMEVVNQIFWHNKMGKREIYRMNINQTTPEPSRRPPVHTDHSYAHANMLIYLNQFDGGRTLVEGVRGPKPMEDMIVSFNGVSHTNDPPSKSSDRRVVMVITHSV